jgi:hypothetical protein
MRARVSCPSQRFPSHRESESPTARAHARAGCRLPDSCPGRGGGDHHIADIVDRGDQTRQLDDVGPVAIEDQDGPGVVECAAELYDLPTRSEE